MSKILYNVYPTLLDSFYWAKRLGKWQELIDKINRVKSVDFPDAVLKGMAFESVVNNCLNKVYNQKLEIGGKLIYRKERFDFDSTLVDRVVYKLQNNTGMQKYIEGVVETSMGAVKCYGFVDFCYDDFYIDLKTTGTYKKDKYQINAQHKCYPLIGGKKSLTYLITDFNNIYQEPYLFTSEMKEKFIFELTEFLEWLNQNKNQITDSKIFNF